MPPKESCDVGKGEFSMSSSSRSDGAISRGSVTAAIFCGLGNQMFQYAAACALSLRCRAPLYLDTGYFRLSESSRSFQLSVFPHLMQRVAGIESASPTLLRRVWKRFRQHLPGFPEIREPHFSYWPEFHRLRPPVVLWGYWQCEKYFAGVQAEIRHDFTFPPLPDGPARELAARIAGAPEAVSVHIRRGDYVSNPQAQAFHGNLQHSYYSAALKHIMETCGPATLFLFSDDPQWVRENFDACGHAAFVVDLAMPEAPHHDMHLMSLCKHHIIANSSFSWWGAWLGQTQGLTFAPRRWFADKSIDAGDVCPERWIRL